MSDILAEWILKVEGDFNSAQRELRARRAPNYDSACFHCQQCVENISKHSWYCERSNRRAFTI
ncbi:MAG: HEPN domain-containing protein [Chloroflexi bacterium]|nr:HEPN domain-containing protein [Chloroflexota bacterium]